MRILTPANEVNRLLGSSVGFEPLFGDFFSSRPQNNLSHSDSDCNIEVVDNDSYVITLAIPGFKQADLDITVHNNCLVVRGTVSEESQNHEKNRKEYLHHGFNISGFERQFKLAEHMEVESAHLENGILSIQLKRDVPEEAQPKQIKIGVLE